LLLSIQLIHVDKLTPLLNRATRALRMLQNYVKQRRSIYFCNNHL